MRATITEYDPTFFQYEKDPLKGVRIKKEAMSPPAIPLEAQARNDLGAAVHHHYFCQLHSTSHLQTSDITRFERRL